MATGSKIYAQPAAEMPCSRPRQSNGRAGRRISNLDMKKNRGLREAVTAAGCDMVPEAVHSTGRSDYAKARCYTHFVFHEVRR